MLALEFNHDVQMQLVSGRGIDPKQPLASPPTLCRLENRVSRQTLVEIAKVLVEFFIASHKQPPKELVLDFDATDDPVHGHQAGRFFHGYYDHYCFLPLYVFCGGQLLVAYLRPANIDAAKAVGKLLAERAVKNGVKEVVFDRGGYLYHGRVKALADAARASGLSF